MAVVAFILLLRFDASSFSSSGTCVCTQSCLCVVSRLHKILLFDMPFFFFSIIQNPKLQGRKEKRRKFSYVIIRDARDHFGERRCFYAKKKNNKKMWSTSASAFGARASETLGSGSWCRCTRRGRKKEIISIAIPTARSNWNDEFGDDDAYEDDERGRRESERFSGIAGQKQMQDRLAYTKSKNSNRDAYDYPPTRRETNGRKNRGRSNGFEDEYEAQSGGSGRGGNRGWSNNNQQRPRLFPRELDKFLVAGAFVVGIGAGVVFDTSVDLEPSNVASREIIDRRTPSSEVCMANGASAMVFDQRVFLSLNPFNVYVAQPEVKPGCVLRRSNWSVLEREKVVSQEQENDCKRNLNTFAYVGDLKKSPEVSCVYHSEEAENQFMKDPSKAVLGDGVSGNLKGKSNSGGNKSFR